MRNAFAAGAFDKGYVTVLPVSGNKGEPVLGVTIDPTFAKQTYSLYGSADKVSASRPDATAAFDFGKLTRIALANTSISQTTAVFLTTVAIGKPIILTADEQNLKVPPSISKHFDVYWVQLAINPRADLRGKVDELLFFVSLKTADLEALDLVPLRYGMDTENKITTGIPEVKLEAKEVGISVGQVYSREVAYKTLKPTIVGTGLQATEFGWSLSDEMIDMSAKRLIAIVGVPKNAPKLEFEMVVTARTNPRTWGMVQGNVTSSKPESYSTKLPRAN